jgi:Ni,Fe-hydrogenase III small subunit
MKKSPWIVHYNASSCNGCDLELVATLTPMYDPERFGIINTGNPKHADLLLVTGSVNARNASVLETLFDQMPSPKAVVAIGICATSGCVFQEAYNVLGGVDKVLPVDVYVPGCAARPEAILDGIFRALDVLEGKRLELKKSLGAAADQGKGTGIL